MLWLVVVSLGLLGLGIGTLVVTFHVIAQTTMCVHYTLAMVLRVADARCIQPDW